MRRCNIMLPMYLHCHEHGHVISKELNSKTPEETCKIMKGRRNWVIVRSTTNHDQLGELEEIGNDCPRLLIYMK